MSFDVRESGIVGELRSGTGRDSESTGSTGLRVVGNSESTGSTGLRSKTVGGHSHGAEAFSVGAASGSAAVLDARDSESTGSRVGKMFQIDSAHEFPMLHGDVKL